MRRVIVRHGNGRGDDGAILVMVALLMVALIGMAALVVDVGALVQERRTLQNGADAAALAVALDCAKGACGAASTTADTYADLNADDSLANIAEICGSGPGLSGCSGSAPAGVGAGWVKVTASTAASGGSSIVRFIFGPVIGGGNGATVTRTAVVTWGTISRVTTLPITISSCEFTSLVGNVDNLPIGPVYIYFHDAGNSGVTPSGCPAGTAGSDSPISGGFGWLDASSGCSITITSGNWIADKPGNAIPNGCDPTTLRNKEVVVPLYDGTNGLNGNNGQYHVSGFAMFRIEGYKFSGAGQSWNMPANKCPLGNGANAVCIKGTFLRFATNIGDLTGTGTDYGVVVTKLVG